MNTPSVSTFVSVQPPSLMSKQGPPMSEKLPTTQLAMEYDGGDAGFIDKVAVSEAVRTFWLPCSDDTYAADTECFQSLSQIDW